MGSTLSLWRHPARTIIVLGVVVVALAGFVFLLEGLTNHSALAVSPFHLVQNEADIVAAPATLERLSWGAVLAGAIIAIMLQLALNLLGIAVGLTSLKPAEPSESAEVSSVLSGTAIWMGISVLISLFIGGWLAARFAGIPDQVDGLLHGLMVWGIVTLVSLFLISSTLGRMMSGVSALLGQGLTLLGSTAQGVAQGVGGVARGVGHVAGSVGHVAADVAGGAANRVQDAANTVRNTVEDAVDEMRDPNTGTMNNGRNSALESVIAEARQALTTMGLAPERVASQVRGAVDDVRNAAENVVQNPSSLDQNINDALMRVLQRGQRVVDQADRDAIVRVLAERGNLSEQQARETLQNWEVRAEQARHEFEKTRQQVENKVAQVQGEVQHRVEEVRQEVQYRVEEAKHEVERVAREAAQTTTQTIARLASIAFAAIAIGALAAGIGGLIGAPENIPSVEVTDTTANNGGSF